jgi:hypothetical protein
MARSRQQTQGNAGLLEDTERKQVLAALKPANWVVAGPRGAAALLGVKRSTLQAQDLGFGFPLRQANPGWVPGIRHLVVSQTWLGSPLPVVQRTAPGQNPQPFPLSDFRVLVKTIYRGLLQLETAPLGPRNSRRISRRISPIETMPLRSGSLHEFSQGIRGNHLKGNADWAGGSNGPPGSSE